MGDPRRKELSFEDEAAEVLGGGGTANDSDFDAEAAGVLQQPSAAAPEGEPPGVFEQFLQTVFPHRSEAEARANPLGIGDDSRAAAAAWQSAADHPYRALGGQLLSQAAPALVPGNGVLSAAATGELAGAADHYSRSEDGSVWDALVGGLPAAAVGGAVALGGKALGAIGKGTQWLADRARMASLGATADDVAEAGMTPREFSQRSDELGLNNRVLPMSREAKLERAGAALDDAGARQAAAIAEADAAGVGANRDWGGEIARDIDANADNVWRGGSGQRGQIVGAMQRAASAAEDHPMESLADLRRYKTARSGEAYTNALGGLDESAAGKAALAAADSAGQHLDQSMYQAGPELYGQYTGANRDYGDAAMFEELLQQSRPQNPVADAAAAIGGTAISGGNPLGGVAGWAARRAVAPYAIDASANLGNALAPGLQGAGSAVSGASVPASMSRAAMSGAQQQEQLQNDSRGHLQPDAVSMVLERNPQALGKYAPELAEAKKNGNLGAAIYRLQMKDPFFAKNILPQIQGLTTEPGM